MNEYTGVVLLCEDRQQEVFAREFLISCGIEKRRIYPDICPKGKQAGEQFVREKYPRSVSSYRKKANHITNVLVVLTDADTLTVQARLQRLSNELQNHEISARLPEERIGLFIPKRNIETWIHFLVAGEADEETIYPHLEKESQCKPYVERLAQNRRQPLPETAPTSLKAACDEITRILE